MGEAQKFRPRTYSNFSFQRVLLLIQRSHFTVSQCQLSVNGVSSVLTLRCVTTLNNRTQHVTMLSQEIIRISMRISSLLGVQEDPRQSPVNQDTTHLHTLIHYLHDFLLRKQLNANNSRTKNLSGIDRGGADRRDFPTRSAACQSDRINRWQLRHELVKPQSDKWTRFLLPSVSFLSLSLSFYFRFLPPFGTERRRTTTSGANF